MDLLTTKDLAKRLGISIGTVYRMVNSGKIPALRIGRGRTLRFDFEEVKQALAEESFLPTSPAQPTREDPLLTLHKLAVDTGIKDLAQNHDHYLYGVPIK